MFHSDYYIGVEECDARSFVGGEGCGELGELSFFFPTGSYSLPLGDEIHSTLAVEVVASCNRLLVSGKGEHRERHWDGDVDSHLPALDLSLELMSSRTGFGENGTTVAVGIGVYEVDCFLESFGVETDQDRTEDLFFIAGH